MEAPPERGGVTAAVLGRLVARAREHGFRAFARKVFEDHVYRRSSSVIMEYRHEWGGGAARTFTPDPATTFTMVEPGDAVPPLAPFLAHRRADFERMLAESKVGMFVADAGGAFGCVWLAYSDHRDAASREFYRVGPGEAYHYCWLLDPDRRRSSAALDMMRFMFAVARERGLTRQFGVIDRVNRPSYQIHKRLSYREAGVEVIHLYVLHTRWTFMRRYDGTLGLYANAGRT